MIPPKYLCRFHLLGEHGEIHKHRHCFVKKYKIDGRMEPIVQIEPVSMSLRHDELVREMIDRGYNHKSPYVLPDLSYLPSKYLEARVDIEVSYAQLSGCIFCMDRIEVYGR